MKIELTRGHKSRFRGVSDPPTPPGTFPEHSQTTLKKVIFRPRRPPRTPIRCRQNRAIPLLNILETAIFCEKCYFDKPKCLKTTSEVSLCPKDHPRLDSERGGSAKSARMRKIDDFGRFFASRASPAKIRPKSAQSKLG